MGEFRTVTVLFICIHSINFQTARDNPPPSQPKSVAHPFLGEAFPKHGRNNKSLCSSQANQNSIGQFAQAQRASRRNSRVEDADNDDPFAGFASTWRRNADPADANALFPSASRRSSNADSSWEPEESSLISVSSLSSPATSRLCVSYAEGLDAYVDSARARANTLQSSILYDASDISQNLQLAVTTIQTELMTLEGDVNKLVADDKGLIAVAVFGLPPMYAFVSNSECRIY